MQLLFAWVKQYNNLSKQSLSFTSEYIISYHSDRYITFTSNHLFLPGFFHPGTGDPDAGEITSVSAIVGSNGSGKSSTLEFICECFRSRGDSFSEIGHMISGILVFRSDDRLHVFDDDIRIEKIYTIPKDHKSFEIDLTLPESGRKWTRESFPYHDIIPIYFSSSWVDRIIQRNYHNWELLNISNTHNFYYSHFGSVVDRERGNTYTFIDHPNRHISEDVIKQAIFIEDNKEWLRSEFGIQYPVSLEFGPVQKFTWKDEFNHVFQSLFNWFQPAQEKEFNLLFFAAASLIAYVFPNPLAERHYHDQEYAEREIFRLFLAHHAPSFDALIRYLELHPLNRPKKYDSDHLDGSPFKSEDHKVPETIRYLRFIQELIMNDQIEMASSRHSPFNDYRSDPSEGKKQFNVLRVKMPFRYAKQLLELYLDHLHTEVTTDHLNFEPLNLSNGETALITFYARLRHRYNNEVTHFHNFKGVRGTDTNDLLFLIDEADSWLHPQWQKKFILSFIQSLPRIFRNKKLQLIFTTHSPLFLSDLPKDNVIFLKRNDEGQAVVTSMEEHKETFAANVHTLLSDSFFLKGGHIGDFAKGKIDRVIELLQKKLDDITENEQEEIRIITEIIGEPLIKSKLLRMQEEKTGASIIDVYNRIRSIEQTLKRNSDRS